MSYTPYVKSICAIALLLLSSLFLSCSDPQTPTPQPTPIWISSHDLIANYELNRLLADRRFEGNPVLVQGIQEGVGEKSSGEYVLLIGSGFRDSYSVIQCETYDLPTTLKEDGVRARGIVSSTDQGEIILKDCYSSHDRGQVVPTFISSTGDRPTVRNLTDACAVLDKAGFYRVADDTDFNQSDRLVLSRAVHDLGVADKETVFALAAVAVITKGIGTEHWCKDWQ